jgi:hypothetical protein
MYSSANYLIETEDRRFFQAKWKPPRADKTFSVERLMTASGSNPLTRETATSTLAASCAQQDELWKLGSVLNGLEGGAIRMRKRVYELAAAVRAGKYAVDAKELSRCIVRECGAGA